MGTKQKALKRKKRKRQSTIYLTAKLQKTEIQLYAQFEIEVRATFPDPYVRLSYLRLLMKSLRKELKAERDEYKRLQIAAHNIAKERKTNGNGTVS